MGRWVGEGEGAEDGEDTGDFLLDLGGGEDG